MAGAGAPDGDEYLTVREAAALCRVSDHSIRNWILSGRLRADRLPGPRGLYRIRRSWLQAEIEALNHATPE